MPESDRIIFANPFTSNFIDGQRVPPHGRLLMQHVLGSGAEGTVALAKDEHGRLFVCKISLRPSRPTLISVQDLHGAPPPVEQALASYDEMVRRLKRHHPQIPHFWGIKPLRLGNTSVDALAMDYRGPNGKQCLRVMTGFDALQLAGIRHYIGRSLVGLVQELWSVGITHNDIKLENVTIDETGTVCLVDFGRAGFSDRPLQKQDCIHDTRGLGQVLGIFGIPMTGFLDQAPPVHPEEARKLIRQNLRMLAALDAGRSSRL